MAGQGWGSQRPGTARRRGAGGAPVGKRGEWRRDTGEGTWRSGPPIASRASGIATFSTLSINLAGTKHLDASTGSLGPVASDAFDITAAAAASLSFDQQPTNAGAGVAIAPAVKVKAT